MKEVKKDIKTSSVDTKSSNNSSRFWNGMLTLGTGLMDLGAYAFNKTVDFLGARGQEIKNKYDDKGVIAATKETTGKIIASSVGSIAAPQVASLIVATNLVPAAQLVLIPVGAGLGLMVDGEMVVEGIKDATVATVKATAYLANKGIILGAEGLNGLGKFISTQAENYKNYKAADSYNVGAIEQSFAPKVNNLDFQAKLVNFDSEEVIEEDNSNLESEKDVVLVEVNDFDNQEQDFCKSIMLDGFNKLDFTESFLPSFQEQQKKESENLKSERLLELKNGIKFDAAKSLTLDNFLVKNNKKRGKKDNNKLTKSLYFKI